MSVLYRIDMTLFVITAREAPLAVVIRRGPSAWVHLTLWDMRNDSFTPGAWFRGRIYEEKCDLSPDGELFVYAAHQGRRLGTSYSDSWTAVSRAPWLHALALWPMHTTYGGGGRFTGKRRLVLRGVSAPHPEHPPHGLEVANGDAPLHASTNEVPDADWSGRDREGRLIFARAGKIYRGDVELADLMTAKPNPQPAPEWATRALHR
jgi:hypothetical protein